GFAVISKSSENDDRAGVPHNFTELTDTRRLLYSFRCDPEHRSLINQPRGEHAGRLPFGAGRLWHANNISDGEGEFHFGTPPVRNKGAAKLSGRLLRCYAEPR